MGGREPLRDGNHLNAAILEFLLGSDQPGGNFIHRGSLLIVETLVFRQGTIRLPQVDFAVHQAVGGFLFAIVSAIYQPAPVHERALGRRYCEELKTWILLPVFQKRWKRVGDVAVGEDCGNA